MNRYLLIIFVFVSIFCYIQCSAGDSLSNEKELLSFAIPNKESSVTTDPEGNLTVKIYESVDITKLVPVIKVSPNAIVSPASGTTIDFTNPVQYTITAQDGSNKEFLVTVELIFGSDKDMLSFVIPNKESSAMLNSEGNLTVKIYEFVDITKLVPAVKVSPNAIVSPASGTTIDFTNPVQYTITAQDGSSKTFMVTVEILLSSEKELLSFAIPNKTTDVVMEGNVLVKVYEYEDITKLTPIITVSPNAVVSPASGTTVDFTNPVQYTITAQDGSTATFTVTVSKALSRNNDIVSITLVGTQQIFEREGDNLYIYTPYETNVTNIGANVVVSDKATVSPASGALINFTTPQIYTVKASDGATKNYLVTVKKNPWRKAGNGPFSPRDGAGLVEFKGKMWLLGGWPHGYTVSEVWNSSDGINWTYITEAPWEPRHCAGFVVFNDAIWVISGDGIANVWKSENGTDWTLVTDTPPWGRRYAPYVAVFKNKLWLMGGLSWWDNDGDYYHDKGVQAYNDVWSSENGGDWILENPNAAWSPRGLIHGYVVLNNELYIIGGGIKGYADQPLSSKTIAEYNDVWKTSDGISWSRVLQHAPWMPRTHFSVTTYNGNIIVNDGSVGEQSGLSNETWYSPDGSEWKQVKYPFWSGTHASSLGVYNNRLWLIAGYGLQTIWSLNFGDL